MPYLAAHTSFASKTRQDKLAACRGTSPSSLSVLLSPPPRETQSSACELLLSDRRSAGVIDGQVLKTVIAKRIVGCPLVAMDGRSWPNLLLNDGDQCVGRAILNDNQKGVVCLVIKTAEHPGSIPESATVILPLAKLTLVDFDDVPNATNLVCLREKARCTDLPED